MKFNMILCCLLFTSNVFAADRLPLWPDEAPVTKSSSEKANAYLTILKPDNPNGASAIICPGGGYGGLVKGPEGTGIAKWLNQHGITGVVLEYRLPKGRNQVPLFDAQRAIRHIRANSKSLGLHPQKIGIIGFSAGGHLAASATVHFDDGNSDNKDPIEQVSCRPDFSILIYPVISMGEKTHRGSKRNLLGPDPSEELIKKYSCELQVTEKSPPAFLAHADDDHVVVPANSQLFHDAQLKHKLPSKYLKLKTGGHGLNRYQGPSWDAWQSQSLEWLKEIKILD